LFGGFKTPAPSVPLKLQTSRGEGFALMAAAMGFHGIYAGVLLVQLITSP
jgi:hypothetical protein